MFVAGGIVVLLMYLQYQQIISVDIEKLQSSLAFILTSVTSSLDKLTLIGDMTSLGLPLTTSLTAGFSLGVLKG